MHIDVTMPVQHHERTMSAPGHILSHVCPPVKKKWARSLGDLFPTVEISRLLPMMARRARVQGNARETRAHPCEALHARLGRLP